jgi:hypothetical protein
LSAAPNGTVFGFSLPDGSQCFGQVLAQREADALIVIFDHRADAGAAEAADALARRPLAFAGLTSLAPFAKGQWKALGSAPLALAPEDWPKFKSVKGQASNTFVEDYLGKRRRNIAGAELDLVEERVVTAPVTYEKALAAFFGLGEWKEHFEKLRIEPVLKRSKIWI